MAVVIQTKNNATGTPASLAVGELAVNTTDGKLWVGSTAGGVISLSDSLLPLDNTWTGLNTFTGGLRSNGAGTDSFRAGGSAGETNQGQYAVALGDQAGFVDQEQYAISIGFRAGEERQGQSSVAVGNLAGKVSQGVGGVAIGRSSGNTSQAQTSIAIGYFAGEISQGVTRPGGGLAKSAIAIGEEAGRNDQRSFGIAIGTNAGFRNQGQSSIAIGQNAGYEYQGGNSIIINSSGAVVNDTSNNNIHIVSGAGSLDFKDNPNFLSKIWSFTGGSVGINTDDPTEKLEVGGDIKINFPNFGFGVLHFGSQTASFVDATKIIGRDNTHASLPDTLAFTTNSVERMRILQNGDIRIFSLAGSGNRNVNVTSSGDLYDTASDGTLKTIIPEEIQGLEAVLAMKPVKFNWIDTDKMGEQVEIGFIAQDMQEIVPEVVGANSNGKLTIDYSVLVAVQAKAIQELTARVAALEA